MKPYYIAFTLLLLTTISTKAQWSIDPADPLVVCDATGAQSKMRVLNIPDGGYYAFWVDERTTGMPHIYGQRYDSLGVAQWITNGKAVTDTAIKASEFNVLRRNDGDLLLVYKRAPAGSFGDTIECVIVDEDGNVLTVPQVIGGFVDGSVLGVGSIEMIEKDNGAYVACMLTYFGGSVGYAMNRVDAGGAPMFGFNGVTLPTFGYGPFAIAPDGTGKVFFYWRTGNGAGAALNVQRIDESCEAMWSAATDPTVGTPGLGYDFRGTYDNNYGLILTWVKNGGDILMSRVDTNGLLTWTPGVLPVCDESHNQDLPRITMHGNNFYVLWQDNRPPAANADVYMQRFNLNGEPQWNPLGVKASGINTYIPYSQLIPSDSGSVIYTIEGSGPDAFRANRIRPDSSTAWLPQGVQIATTAFNPFYDEYKLVTAVDSGAAVFWESNANLYAARIRYSGELFNTIQTINTDNVVTAFPNPATEHITFKLKNEARIIHVSVFAMDGRCVVEKFNPVSNKVNVSELPAGVYILQLKTKSNMLRAKFLKH